MTFMAVLLTNLLMYQSL